MADSCCQKEIDVGALRAEQRRTLIIVLAINVAASAMMLIAAVASGASSLLSGGLDNFGDAVTYALSLAAVGASRRAKARVALFKGLLIVSAALIVAGQIGWRLLHPATPIVETMGLAAAINLAANMLCLWLLSPHRKSDVNMSSAWECSRNDVAEGFAVIAGTAAVWATAAGWPDLLIAIGLLMLFTRSAVRVLGAGWRELRAKGNGAD